MTLAETFLAVRPSVVAFMPTVTIARAGGPPEMFPIIGTGFVLDDGLVVTNAHVIDALLQLPKPPDWPKDRLAFTAFLFHRIDKRRYPNAAVDGYARIPLQIIGILRVGDIELNSGGFYYGPRKPDFNAVRVKMKGLPKVEITSDSSLLREGAEVGTIGFPMGTDALTAPGWLHQISPFLQRGVISTVLPFPCASPHSFVINVMSIGGASGSPVFLADSPKVIGILNAGLTNTSPTVTPTENGLVPIGFTPQLTNFSYVVPSFWMSGLADAVKSNLDLRLPDDTPELDEVLRNASFDMAKAPGHNEPAQPEEVLFEGQDPTKIRIEVKPTSVQ